MTAKQIKSIALKHFALNGYEGTSMAHIANEIGIKKQSIYTHYKGKDDLFLQVCNDAFDNELQTVKSYIDRSSSCSIEEFLYGFLVHFKTQYEKDEYTKFWLRISFFPPSHLYDQVMEYVYSYLDNLEMLLIPIMEQAMASHKINSEIGAEKASSAFLGLLDSIFVEMLYGGPERLEKRMDASWHLYWLGLSKNTGLGVVE